MRVPFLIACVLWTMGQWPGWLIVSRCRNADMFLQIHEFNILSLGPRFDDLPRLPRKQRSRNAEISYFFPDPGMEIASSKSKRIKSGRQKNEFLMKRVYKYNISATSPKLCNSASGQLLGDCGAHKNTRHTREPIWCIQNMSKDDIIHILIK